MEGSVGISANASTGPIATVRGPQHYRTTGYHGSNDASMADMGAVATSYGQL